MTTVRPLPSSWSAAPSKALRPSASITVVAFSDGAHEFGSLGIAGNTGADSDETRVLQQLIEIGAERS
jgi:hypothetical protein